MYNEEAVSGEALTLLQYPVNETMHKLGLGWLCQLRSLKRAQAGHPSREIVCQSCFVSLTV